MTTAGDGIERGGLSSHLYMYFNGGRSVSGHFWPDYHLGGSRRGGLGGLTVCCKSRFIMSESVIHPEATGIPAPVIGFKQFILFKL